MNTIILEIVIACAIGVFMGSAGFASQRVAFLLFSTKPDDISSKLLELAQLLIVVFAAILCFGLTLYFGFQHMEAWFMLTASFYSYFAAYTVTYFSLWLVYWQLVRKFA